MVVTVVVGLLLVIMSPRWNPLPTQSKTILLNSNCFGCFFLHSECVNLQSPSFVLDPINLGSVGSLGEKTSHTCDEVDLDLTLENWIWVNKQLDKLLVFQNKTHRLLTGQSHEYLSMFSRQKHLNYSKGWSWNWIFHHHNKVMWLVLKFATYPRDPHPCGNAHLLASLRQVHLVARPPDIEYLNI